MPSTNEIRIAVLGLGHVGLPTALGFADLGWPVVGADDDVAKAESISHGNVPFHEPGVETLLRRHLDTGRLVIETDTSKAVSEATVLFLCVGTPKRSDGSPDLSQLETVARTIADNLNGHKLVVEKSTTPVQTAQRLKEIVLRRANGNASNGDVDFDMAVNPEFLREGSAMADVFNPDRIVLGVEGKRAEGLLLEVYQPLLERMGSTVEESVVITDINTAEIIKHSSNSFLGTKISFINMVADLCEATGADVGDVARGMGLDPRIGNLHLRAGVGYGGSCLPKDLQAFGWIASSHGVDFTLLREVERINEGRVERFVEKVRSIVGPLDGMALAVWGLAFAPRTDDLREAPSLKIIHALLGEGARLRLYDPQAMAEASRILPANPPEVQYGSSPEETARGARAILILTEWRQFLEVDLSRLRGTMDTPVIVDGRNMFDPAHVRDLGYEYLSIGRP